MTTFQKLSFFIWLFTLIVFFAAGLYSMSLPPETTVSEFSSNVLGVNILVGVLAFLAMFFPLFRSLLSKMIASLSVFQKLAHLIKKNPMLSFVLLLLFIFFLWFQLRPSTVKIVCQRQSDEYRQQSFDRKDTDKDGLISTDSIESIQKLSKYKYENCLHRYGI